MNSPAVLRASERLFFNPTGIGIPTVAVGSSLEIGCPRVKIEKIISLEILELRAENPPIRVVVCHYRFSFWSNSPTRPYGARNGPLRCTMGCVGHIF